MVTCLVEVIDMIATMEYVDVLDCSEALGKMILQSDVMEAYQQAKKDMNEDKQAQHYIKAFNDLKADYDLVRIILIIMRL